MYKLVKNPIIDQRFNADSIHWQIEKTTVFALKEALEWEEESP